MSQLARPELKGRAWILFIALVPLALVLLRTLVISLEDTLRAIAPGCVFHTMTGLHCPGCGATRAVFAMAKGDLRSAWSMNPMLWVCLGLGLFYFIIAVLSRRPGSTVGAKGWARLPVGGGWMIIGAVLLFGVFRNIPYWPFTLLAPH